MSLDGGIPDFKVVAALLFVSLADDIVLARAGFDPVLLPAVPSLPDIVFLRFEEFVPVNVVPASVI